MPRTPTTATQHRLSAEQFTIAYPRTAKQLFGGVSQQEAQDGHDDHDPQPQ